MKKKTILFIDANIKVNQSLIALLTNHTNFNMIYVDSIDETLLAINKNVIDLVVVDPMMGTRSKLLTENELKKCEEGRRTGFVLIKKIKETLPIIPVVFYTTLDKHIINMTFKNVGYVKMPAKSTEIILEVERLLQ